MDGDKDSQGKDQFCVALYQWKTDGNKRAKQR